MGSVLDLETQILHDGTVTGVVLILSGIKTEHALPLLLFESFLPAAKMVADKAKKVADETYTKAVAKANKEADEAYVIAERNANKLVTDAEARGDKTIQDANTKGDQQINKIK
jgi:hypothetical protein